MRRSCFLALSLALALLAAPAAGKKKSSAKEKPKTERPAKEKAKPKGERPLSSKEKKARIAELSKAAEDSYGAGDYEQALASYQAAHDLAKKPALLLKVGECYAALKRYDEAILSYRLYLRGAPKSTPRAPIEEKIREMEVESEKAKAEIARAKEEAERAKEEIARAKEEAARAKEEAAKTKEEAERKLAETERAKEKAEAALSEVRRPTRRPSLLIGTAALGAVAGAFGVQTLLLKADFDSRGVPGSDAPPEIEDAERRKGFVFAVVADASLIAAGGTFLSWVLFKKKPRARGAETRAAEVTP
jgi:tetratricopeptide (TPR) repeat protein